MYDGRRPLVSAVPLPETDTGTKLGPRTIPEWCSVTVMILYRMGRS